MRRFILRLSPVPVLLLCAWTLLAADDRKPVPKPEDQATSLKLIKDLFKDDYAKKTAEAKAALAEKLLAQAGETKDDPVARYMLYVEARTLAAQAGDLTLAVRACDEMVRDYAVEPASVKLALFESAVGSTVGAPANQSLVQVILPAIEEALNADNYEVAAKLHAVAQLAVRKAQSVPLSTQVTARGKDIETQKREFEKIKPFKETLAKSTDDPSANLAMGKYLVLLKGNFDLGLPMLAKGSDAKFKAVADAEKAPPEMSPEQIALADKWYDLAAAQEAGLRMHPSLRALTWYRRGGAELAGLTKTRVDRRISELAKFEAVREKAAQGDVYAALRDAVRLKKSTTGDLAGNQDASSPFNDLPPEGGIMVGVAVTTYNDQRGGFGKGGGRREVLDTIRPIYQTASGEKLGGTYGKNATTVQKFLLKAKAGYAVGGLSLRTGNNVDGLLVKFMKIDGRGLKKDDSYDSTWVGSKGGGFGPQGPNAEIGGDGSLIIGLHGRRHNDGRLGGLGVVTFKAEAPASK